MALRTLIREQAATAFGRCNLPEYTQHAFCWLRQTVLWAVMVKGVVVLPRRWIVERRFGGLRRSRRHDTVYERHTKFREAMICFALTHLILHRLAQGTAEFVDTL